MTYQYIELDINDKIATLWLNRPELHNAFNSGVIAEISHALQAVNAMGDVRVLVLAGRGKSFSAGADLNWMKAAGEASFDDNMADAVNLAAMLHTLFTLSKPTIARVHGAAIGGGLGLAAACDICVASDTASFATSEVKFGLAPSTISPYVIRAIGERTAKRYFLTAERMNAHTACRIGLVHEVCEMDELDNTISTIAHTLCQNAPKAITQAKNLIDTVANQTIDDDLQTYTAHHIASLRQSDEAKSGLQAFLTKGTPNWLQ
ncbi:MAG: enoyl-CoA hydratase/isomerase family protein [Moraxella sp.]|nr:enoyl-CoA hydratase/isomerase family protein [Moraxella sp.]